MCGIVGWYGFRHGSDGKTDHALEAMMAAMRTRGPDGSGQWASRGHPVSLGHLRLAILDLSELGAQPLCDKATGQALVFNGEIYNFRELRRELEREGFAFRSESDTEVLLKAYLHWGEAMLNRLRGMFAFALWDERK
ncbi:MAG: N-acetylglutaminylglutamine amidotransferase, partial [Candidatus Nitrotoga sp.]